MGGCVRVCVCVVGRTTAPAWLQNLDRVDLPVPDWGVRRVVLALHQHLQRDTFMSCDAVLVL